MNKFLYPILHFNIKPWIKYWLYNKEAQPAPVYPLSEIITGASPLTLINSVRKIFNIFNISGNTIQDGTPTPESPIPVENVSGEVEVKVENKNLCSSETIGNNNPVLSNISGHYTGAITIAVKTSSGAAQVNYRIVYEDGTTYNNYIMLANSANNVWNKINYTTTKPIAKIGLYYISTGGTRTAEHIMFLKGTYTTITDADYVAHAEQTVTLHLPEGFEMCKVSNYYDKFVKQNGVWYKNKYVGSLKLRGSGNWIFSESNHTFQLSWDLNNVTTAYCTHYKWNTSASVNFSFYVHRYGVRITDDRFESLADFKTFITNNDVYIYYYLRDAVVSLQEITDTTLISDLENLKNLYSYKGTTHISSTNEPSPVFEVQYYMEGE